MPTPAVAMQLLRVEAPTTQQAVALDTQHQPVQLQTTQHHLVESDTQLQKNQTSQIITLGATTSFCEGGTNQRWRWPSFQQPQPQIKLVATLKRPPAVRLPAE
jgi:hypothetical protein